MKKEELAKKLSESKDWKIVEIDKRKKKKKK